MRRPLRTKSAPILILLALTGCDNVTWGGADVQFVPPPPPMAADQIEPDAQAFAEFGLPSGPLVFYLTEGPTGGWQLTPVAEIVGDTMRTIRRPANVSPEAYEGRFRETVIPIGAQFEVFRRGARVGTFIAQSYGPITTCGVPTAIGNTTVVAAAADAKDFLAYRQGLSPTVRGEYVAPQLTGPIRTYASIVAERLILDAGLPRPRSWPGAQRDLQPIDVISGGHPEMAATYLVGDSLAVGPADPNGYSVFYLADYETQRGYIPIYTDVRDYRRTGKAAPRLIDYLDWDGVEGAEILLKVFGRTDSWFEVLSQRSGEWKKVYEGEPCV
jgi:hypothetical protein